MKGGVRRIVIWLRQNRMPDFIDSSAFFALLDRDDANHNKAKSIWSSILGDDTNPLERADLCPASRLME